MPVRHLPVREQGPTARVPVDFKQDDPFADGGFDRTTLPEYFTNAIPRQR